MQNCLLFNLFGLGPCYVDLEFYPFNEEECELVLESYAYNVANVRLKWRDWDPVSVYEGIGNCIFKKSMLFLYQNINKNYWLGDSIPLTDQIAGFCVERN